MISSNCCFLTCIQLSQEAGQVVWYSHLLKNFPQFIVVYTVKDFGIVNKAEMDVYLELCWFFDDPVNVGNWISGSSAFSKTSFNIHILLKPGLENFEHYFTSMWGECNCVVVWAFFGIFFEIGMKTDLFQSYGHCWVFQICWHIECSTFTASSFRIWNSSTGIPSPPLGLFVVMPPEAPLTSHSRMSGSRWVVIPLWLSGSKESPYNARDPSSWVGKSLWIRKWQPTPVFLPKESYGQKTLADYSPWGCKELDWTEN